MSKNIMIISATTRPERMGKPVTAWVKKELESMNADVNFSIADLEDMDLPFLNEPKPPAQAEGSYEFEHTKAWSKQVTEADGFVIVTPEYNAGYPAPLKNAIDYLYGEWEGKPVAFVGYGAGPAANSIKQLREVTDRVKMVNVEASIAIPQVWEALDDEGNVKAEAIQGSLDDLLTELTSKLS